jgi:hypothetical protein
MSEPQCEHDFAWAPDGLDAMCRKCELYVMKPECVSETNRWLEEHFPKLYQQLKVSP